MESVIFRSPLLLALVIASAALALWDLRRQSGAVLQILSALLGGAALVCAFAAGASLQELLIVVLLMLALQMRVF